MGDTSHQAIDPKLESDVKQLVDKAVNDRVATWRRNAYWFGAGITVLAGLGVGFPELRSTVMEKVYPPDAMYERLRKSLREDKSTQGEVAQAILGLIGERVDSGYSKTIYIGPNANIQPGQNALPFYARRGQKVELSIRSQSSAPAQFVLTVDNANIFEDEKLPNPDCGYNAFRRDISAHLRFVAPTELEPDLESKTKAMDIHVLTVAPIGLPSAASASFEILVLVRNEKLQVEKTQ